MEFNFTLAGTGYSALEDRTNFTQTLVAFTRYKLEMIQTNEELRRCQTDEKKSKLSYVADHTLVSIFFL
jgi:hypothetical protein